MPTLTIRNVSPGVVEKLKAQARLHHRSMEQEVREILEAQASDRTSVVEQITRSWEAQARRPSAEEIDAWIDEGRP
ncbi:MAG: hypothetical protein KDD47_13085 [Acidobacteria bacterium]|nr:hypothetical protein [Acidobacteriota bacterium]